MQIAEKSIYRHRYFFGTVKPMIQNTIRVVKMIIERKLLRENQIQIADREKSGPFYIGSFNLHHK